ncbi:HlyC/CorC family transporter [Ktedonosporobacter rubrisoli]|uniref:HlyC/CorC family transporter n=1 Tax=Ktedonosporobacter rubrisoli TaxID=2509675 RepID=A0A4P6K1Z6_KTERU|nr:hemolysin family protein [Ktedonosporobacter rubrisoli]QBD82015.1 HlyC/CorC family transporter [Ktedonosporobacter rubrisoli]
MSGFLGIEIAIILVLMLANGFFSASEIAIVSARRSRLQQQADAGQNGAQQALDLAENPDRFLATIQIGITLISTLTAAFGGASISEPLAQLLKPLPIVGQYASSLSLALVVILITYFSLIIGELVPKRLALQSAESFASFAAPFMVLLAKVARPLVVLLTGSVNLVLAVLGPKKAEEASVTEEDILYLARQGFASGTVEKGESEFINRIFRFTDRYVNTVMTPRTEMSAIEVSTPLSKVIATFLDTGYSRLPLYEDSLDNIIGVIFAKDLLRLQADREEANLAELARQAYFVTEYQHVDDLLTLFRRKGIHLAIVIDEYSQVVGLVTIEDMLEELVGEIQDEYDVPEPNAFVQREDGSWLVDAMVPQDLAREKIGLQPIPTEESGEYHTLAGMVLAHLGHIPKVGDSVTIGDFVFEVVDMDGRRIDKVLIRPKQ